MSKSKQTITADAEVIGSGALAAEIAQAHEDRDIGDLPDGWERIGAGQHRTVYLHHATATVYKVGDDSANRHEVRVMAELRAAGHGFAPAATLYQATVAEYAPPGVPCERVTRTVVAMPYLPEDGSVDGDRAYIAAHGGDFSPANCHANGGRLWLIDAGGL